MSAKSIWPPPRYMIWLLLAAPAAAQLWPIFAGADYRFILRPSGEFAAELLVAALAISPIRTIFPRAGWSLWLVRQRRYIGLAAFGYAMIHTVFFVLSIGRLDYLLQGLAWPSMWTGWLALLLLTPLAATSSDAAMRALGRGWKRLQRLAYAAALLTMAHWLLLTRGPGEALVWFLPLGLLELARIAISARRRPGGQAATHSGARESIR